MPPYTGTRSSGGGGLSEAEVDARVAVGTAALVDSAPAALNTLNELAAALADNADFAGAMTTALAAKANTAADNITAATWRTALDVLAAAAVAEVDGSNVDAATWRTALDVLQDSAIAAAYAASADIRTIDVVTQAAYDALGTPDANTLYVIVG